jgi:hypothetical protein
LFALSKTNKRFHLSEPQSATKNVPPMFGERDGEAFEVFRDVYKG